MIKASFQRLLPEILFLILIHVLVFLPRERLMASTMFRRTMSGKAERSEMTR